MQVTKPILSVQKLKKSFSGKTVVNDVSFDIYPGEIVALVGENGAGKSTTKNMLCGLLQPTSGEIVINGVSVERLLGIEHGISAVHQELSLFQSLTVAENMCISQLPGKSFKVDWQQADKIARDQLAYLGIDIDTQATVESLGAGKQQVVEIAKALLHADKLIILDEPTTSLTKPEREKLFILMNRLKAKGIAIIFITHFMDEIYEMGDKYIVLRDGQQVGTGALKDTPRKALEEMMVGRAISESVIDIGLPTSVEAIRVESLSSYDFHNISFSVNKGEILGIAGLMGAGRTEIAEAIFGIREAQGEIYIDNAKVSPITISNMKAHQMCYITEDRRINGLFSIRSVKENLSAAAINKFTQRVLSGFGFKGEKDSAQKVVDEMNISIPNIDSAVSSLSGGNQQKVLLGRWLATQPKICILDEPTKGVDVGAKFDIHNKIVALAKKGVAIIIISSDLPEILQLSHRLIVMRAGHNVGEFARSEFDSVKIISLAASSSYERTTDKQEAINA